ncbi:MAG: hypothetical protein HY000_00225 [Planctomycetes bacterium]|nr:hypothetical protein [Planctomycetota bacterium]
MEFHLLICVNLLPVGTYFCVLGLLHAAGRPLVTTGIRDFLALALALSGLAITGPLHVLLHSRLLPGPLAHTWWAGLGLYLLLVGMLAPRSFETLVIYNGSETTVVAALRTILERLNTSVQEVPGGWILPARGILLEMDSLPVLNNVSLQFRGVRDTLLFRQIQRELADLLAETRTGWPAIGITLAAAGGLILALPISLLARDAQGITMLVRLVIDK